MALCAPVTCGESGHRPRVKRTSTNSAQLAPAAVELPAQLPAMIPAAEQLPAQLPVSACQQTFNFSHGSEAFRKGFVDEMSNGVESSANGEDQGSRVLNLKLPHSRRAPLRRASGTPGGSDSRRPTFLGMPPERWYYVTFRTCTSFCTRRREGHADASFPGTSTKIMESRNFSWHLAGRRDVLLNQLRSPQLKGSST
jgi:hypothetical protein